jgi:hypothetical protein
MEKLLGLSLFSEPLPGLAALAIFVADIAGKHRKGKRKTKNSAPIMVSTSVLTATS